MTDYAKIFELNDRIKDDGLEHLHVPVIPTVGMMAAALAARDVFRPGDRLGDYVVAFEREPEEAHASLPPSLVSQFGEQQAWAATVMADAWAGCVDGYDEWLVRRGREGSTDFVNSWLRAKPHDCPPGGWPETKELCTDAHREHARSTDIPSSNAAANRWWDGDRRLARVMPPRCVGIMALRARQKESTACLFESVEECVDTAKLPYVPYYTREGRFDDEERGSLLIAAMWKAAVSWLRDPGRAQPEPMPFGDRNQAALLVAMLAYKRKVSATKKDFFAHAPYGKVEVSVEGGYGRFEIREGLLDYEVSLPDGSLSRRPRVDLRVPDDYDRLEALVAELDRHDVTTSVFTTLGG